MTEVLPLRWSDVWFLVALYYCGKRCQDGLKDAIAAADQMCHAVMNFEELSGALVRLEAHGFIAVQKEPWRARCTIKGNVIVDAIARKNSLSYRVMKETQKALHVRPWQPGELLPHPENFPRYPDFLQADHEREVAGYLNDMRRRR